MKALLVLIYHVLILFCFLFEFRLIGFITTRRMSIIIAFVTLFFRRKELINLLRSIDRKRLEQSAMMMVACMILVSITSLAITIRDSNSVYLEPYYFINLFLYIYLFSFYCAIEFKTYEKFAASYLVCFLIQFIAVIYSVINTDVRMFFYDNFYSGEDYIAANIENGSRIFGIALHSSGGSIICSTCAVVLVYLTIQNKLSAWKFYMPYAFLMILTVFIARTGVLVELCLLIYYLITRDAKSFVKNSFLIAGFAFFVIYVILQILSSIDPAVEEYFKEWMTAAFNSEGRNKTIEGINRQIPDFSSSYILGTSVFVGHVPNGDYVQSDSGYIMNYIAMGIIGSLVYYLGMIKLYNIPRISIYQKPVRRFFYLLILLSFIMEYKEPFMFKYVFPFIIPVITQYCQYFEA